MIKYLHLMTCILVLAKMLNIPPVATFSWLKVLSPSLVALAWVIVVFICVFIRGVKKFGG